MTPEVRALRGGVVALGVLHAVKGVNGADDARAGVGLLTVQHGAQHVGDRGLALGARDAHDLDVVVGVAEGVRGGVCHGAAQVGGHEGGYAGGRLPQGVCVLLVAQIGDSALLERAHEVGRAECLALAHEDVPRADDAGVAVAAGDGRGARFLREVADLGERPPRAEKLGDAAEVCRIHGSSIRPGAALAVPSRAYGTLAHCSGDWRSG